MRMNFWVFDVNTNRPSGLRNVCTRSKAVCSASRLSDVVYAVQTAQARVYSAITGPLFHTLIEQQRTRLAVSVFCSACMSISGDASAPIIS